MTLKDRNKYYSLEAKLNTRLEAHKCGLGTHTRGALGTIGSGPNTSAGAAPAAGAACRAGPALAAVAGVASAAGAGAALADDAALAAGVGTETLLLGK